MAKIKFGTKTAGVVEQVRNEILSGTLKPGTQLPQDSVAERLGVSSTPVREAFSILETEGFLTREPHRGVVVADCDSEALADIFDVRGVLEAFAARKAAERRDSASFTRLRRAIADAQRALASDNMHHFRGANAAFHKALLAAAESETLTEITETLVARSLFSAPLNEQRVADVHDDHRKILAALERGNGERAARLVLDHMDASAKLLRRGRLDGKHAGSSE